MKYQSNKKSQLTLLMIIGLVLFIIVSFLFYLSKSSIKKQSQQSIKNTQETAIDTQPIKEFVSKCLDKVAKDAILLLGKQGGYLYKSQGGPLMDHRETDQGKFILKYQEMYVTYNILPPKFYVQLYTSSPPDYPWLTYPYSNANSNSQVYYGFFGINNMPPLNFSEGPNSIQTQIETYVDENIRKCANLDIFEKQGLEISIALVKTSVIIGRNDVSVKLKIPITIYNPTTKEYAEIREASTSLDVRLKDIYFFAKELIKNDIENIKFNIKDPKNERDSISIQLVENVFSKDDVIIITDEESTINGNPYKYIFSRRNRPPALYYIKQNVLSFPQGYVISEDDLLGDIKLAADDPDEDNLTFSIKALAADSSLPKILNVPQLQFRVEVSDGKLSDYQIITVNRI